ncbi:hypothetical protein V2I01_11670 [Micromonospora sp. BRA006-A]|nr:hypothetical protein [Micromonospora sp. BRA006-A]
MLRRAPPARPEARRILLGTLFSAVGRGLTLPFLFIYLTDVRGLTDTRAGLVIGWFGAVTLALRRWPARSSTGSARAEWCCPAWWSRRSAPARWRSSTRPPRRSA